VLLHKDEDVVNIKLFELTT